MSSEHLGHFRWNAGGWFGSQLGGTLWLLTGVSLLFQSPAIAALLAKPFLLAYRSELGNHT